MRDETLALLDEFAAAWARGETPDPREVVARASVDEQAMLTEALDRYLAGAPPRAASEESRAFVAAIAAEAEAAAEPPLLALRLERRLTRDAVVDGLMSRLGLDPAKRAKVRRYFSDLEVGVLDPRGVAASVWEALGQLLGGEPEALALARARPAPKALSAYYRVVDLSRADEHAAPPAAAAPASAEPDEVDRLFTSRN